MTASYQVLYLIGLLRLSTMLRSITAFMMSPVRFSMSAVTSSRISTMSEYASLQISLSETLDFSEVNN